MKDYTVNYRKPKEKSVATLKVSDVFFERLALLNQHLGSLHGEQAFLKLLSEISKDGELSKDAFNVQTLLILMSSIKEAFEQQGLLEDVSEIIQLEDSDYEKAMKFKEDLDEKEKL